MRAERIVLDTNVLISAALNALGKPFACLVWARRNAEIVASQPLLDELVTRLERPKFRKYRSMDEVRTFAATIAANAAMIATTGTLRASRDPNDDMILETAVAARADVIITGDEDLLVLDPFHGIRIVTPAAFLALVEA